MHGGGSSGPIVVLSISPGSEDTEHARLQDLAHRAGSSRAIVRDPDMVLFDYLDGNNESDVLPPGLLGSELSIPSSVGEFKRDYSDYRKFGGDVVSMELDRSEPRVGMSDVEMDDLLGFTMDSSSISRVPPDSSDSVSEAMYALEEHFGSNVMAVLESDSDGIVVFSVDSPEFGRVKYWYDSRDGVGRVIRGE